MITCKFENDDNVSLRHIVTSAIIIKEGKVLLEKRGCFRGKPISESGKWALIGGYLDRNENLEQGIQREVGEETGWEITNLQLFHINDNPKRPREDRQNVAMIFIASPKSQTPVKTEEVLELRWFGLDDLPPKDKTAFDHYDELILYKRYLKENFSIPVLGILNSPNSVTNSL